MKCPNTVFYTAKIVLAAVVAPPVLIYGLKMGVDEFMKSHVTVASVSKLVATAGVCIPALVYAIKTAVEATLLANDEVPLSASHDPIVILSMMAIAAGIAGIFFFSKKNGNRTSIPHHG
jgi:hypothetical protein